MSRAISASRIKDYPMLVADLEKLFNLNADKKTYMIALNSILENINNINNKNDDDIKYENIIKDYIDKLENKN